MCKRLTSKKRFYIYIHITQNIYKVSVNNSILCKFSFYWIIIIPYINVIFELFMSYKRLFTRQQIKHNLLIIQFYNKSSVCVRAQLHMLYIKMLSICIYL